MAHKLLMEEDHFKSKILPDKAKKLAAKLYYSLRPLMAAHDQSTLGFCPTDLFLDTLLCSLELKSKLLLSGKTFKLVYFYPGDTFDPENMMQDGDTSEHLMQMKGGRKKGLSIKGGTGPSKEVKLCIFPALYMEPNGPRGFGLGLGTVANLDRWLVGYDNIHAGSSAGDLQELVLVVKAVVLV